MTEEIKIDDLARDIIPPSSPFKMFLKGFWGELIQIVIISLIIVIPFRLYIAQPFMVSGPSMDNTFTDGQYLIVDELSYRFNEPKRGDVLIFRPPDNPSVFYIKRLLGLPGETIQIKNNVVTIFNQDNPQGKVLNEPYVKIDLSGPTRLDAYVTLKADQYYVLGDNRQVSKDSRVFGPISKSEIKGRPFLRLLPLNKINLFPGQFEEK
jgi:signal peptidase I